jgi:dUTP pyrophosphatase
MIVPIKKLHPEAHLPEYTKSNAAMDLVATTKIFDEFGCVEFGTGISIEIPSGYIGLIFPRSINGKKDLLLADSVMVVNPNDHSEIKLKFRPSAFFADDCPVPSILSGKRSDTFDYVCFGKECIEDENNMDIYNVGDRIGQLIIIPRPHIEWSEVVDYVPNANTSTTT